MERLDLRPTWACADTWFAKTMDQDVYYAIQIDVLDLGADVGLTLETELWST